jgi:hypothetical protein
MTSAMKSYGQQKREAARRAKKQNNTEHQRQIAFDSFVQSFDDHNDKNEHSLGLSDGSRS